MTIFGLTAAASTLVRPFLVRPFLAFLTLGGSLCRSELLFCLLERCVKYKLKLVDVGSAGLVRRHSSCFPLLC